MRALAISLALACAACGSVYDASGIRALPSPPGSNPGGDPGGLVCGAGQVVCGGTCTTEDAQHCGTSCTACPVPFAGAVATCNAGACSHVCADGKLACAGGCCAPLAVAAGAAHACAVAEGTGEVFCWGANGSGQLGTGDAADRAAPARVAAIEGATAVAAGGAHTCALLGTGALQCFGAAAALPPAGTTASAVAAGDGHTCAIVGGAVQCWGLGGTPSIVGATRLAAGAGFACAATATAVQCWGSLATGFSSAVTGLAAGRAHVCAAAAGGPFCWGDNASAQLGTGIAGPAQGPTVAARLPNGADVVAAGGDFTCALKTPNASFKCAGLNTSGELGSGLATDHVSDVAFPANVTAIAAGGAHGCAIAGGALWCWGANDRGQTGAGAAGAPMLPGLVVAR